MFDTIHLPLIAPDVIAINYMLWKKKKDEPKCMSDILQRSVKVTAGKKSSLMKTKKTILKKALASS